MNAPAASTRWLLLLIMLALIGWGLLHAMGAAWGARPLGQNPWRGLIVLACFAAFLGVWGIALALRARRKRLNAREREE